MKQAFILLVLLIKVSSSYAQYDKEKLTSILTANSWSVKGSNANFPEKSFTFNNDMTVQVGKDNGKGVVASQKEKWSISSSDQIRWFITIGSQTHELIISYAKNGSQYVKLTRQDKLSGLVEMNLYPLK